MYEIETDIDERWLAEWVEFGIKEFERYLVNHLSFDDYYSRRNRTRAASQAH